MEKKLRDLTKEEYTNWYYEECMTMKVGCSNCPFKSVSCDPQDDDCWINHKELYSDKYYEQVIRIKDKKPKLTESEKIILKNLEPSLNFKYIARDKDDILFVYKEKPYKNYNCWRCINNLGKCVQLPFKNLFQFIRWEDENAYLIDDLLKD